MSRHFVYRLAVLLCGVTAAALWIGPFIGRVDLFEDDAAQHVFWLYRFADPALFPGDLTARFFSLPSSAPMGYRGLYALLATWFDVLEAGEVLAGVLFLVSVALAWDIGRRVVPTAHRELGGLIGAVTVLWLLAQPADAMSTLALQRSFALPITLLMLWGMLGARPAWVACAWLLAALIYPVIIVVLGLAAGSSLLVDMVRERRPLPALWWYVPAGLAAIGIVLAGIGLPDDIGPALGGSQAMAMPEFGPRGRLQLVFGGLTADLFHNHLLGIGWSPRVVLGVAAASLLVVVGGRSSGFRIPRAAWLLLGCGLIVWLAARLTLFDLYLPNRHSRWSFAAFTVAALPVAGAWIWDRFGSGLGAPGSRGQGWAALGLAAVSVWFVASRYLPAAEREWGRPVDTDMERAYAYVATLPVTTLVAAHPDVADFFPLRSRRSVLASTETSLSFMRGYYGALVPRLQASLRATYATDWATVDAILAPLGVDVYVSAPPAWTGKDYFAPFDTLTAGLRRAAGTRPFVLRAPPRQRVLFQSGDVYVVRIGGATESGPGSGQPVRAP